MATYLSGIIGNFSGKVGNVVGSNWRGISCMRSLPRRRKKAASPAQLEQQARFALMVKFLQNFKGLLSSSFAYHARQMTGNNEALSCNLQWGIIGDYPNLAINYAEIKMSHGDLPGAREAAAKAGSEGVINYSWNNDNIAYSIHLTDNVLLIIYNPETKTGLSFKQSGTRGDCMASIDIPEFKGCAVETWITFRSHENKSFADSQYTGTVIIT